MRLAKFEYRDSLPHDGKSFDIEVLLPYNTEILGDSFYFIFEEDSVRPAGFRFAFTYPKNEDRQRTFKLKFIVVENGAMVPSGYKYIRTLGKKPLTYTAEDEVNVFHIFYMPTSI